MRLRLSHRAAIYRLLKLPWKLPLRSVQGLLRGILLRGIRLRRQFSVLVARIDDTSISVRAGRPGTTTIASEARLPSRRLYHHMSLAWNVGRESTPHRCSLLSQFSLLLFASLEVNPSSNVPVNETNL